MEASDQYKMQIGDPAVEFSLPATDGKTYAVQDFSKDLLVIFFTCNHCPYAQAYEERVKKLVQEFKGKADFVAINSNDAAQYPEDSFAHMKERAVARKFTFTYLCDKSQEVARAYGGLCTPHFFVFDKKRSLRYQGRFDDNWKEPEKVMRQELRDALLALSEGRDVTRPVTLAMGCSIKWKG